MARGRPRKAGKRTKSGQLSRSGANDNRRVTGNDRAVANQKRYRSNGHDPIGRAFETGLLGLQDGKPCQMARVRLDTARAMYRAYWPMLGIGRVGCTLGERNGPNGHGNLKAEQWLKRQLDIVGPMGTAERQAFDDLVLDGHFDEGPIWLDRLIAKQPNAKDEQRLNLAIAVIDRLANNA